MRARVEPVPGSLTFRQITETSRWKLTKTWYTDPARGSVLADVRFESKTGRPLQLYVLADPAASDTGDDDRARGMVAWDASSASAVEADPRLRGASAGYRGEASDPWKDLQDYRLSGSSADAPGNVVEGALTALDGVHRERMKLAIGFGRDAGAAAGTARASLRSRDAARDYASGWSSYLASLKRPPASVGRDVRLYQQSLMVLAASEDKLNRGATVAAPNMPWVWGTLTLENPADGHSGPYHLVWPRDFYHVVTAQSAAGDSAAAARQLDYLWRIQKPDGSWWQNTEPDGDPHWTGLQMDEVALPVVLAWWLGRTGPGDWAHIQKAADFIAANGPKTGQERWENQDGYSPNTIATEIAGLVTAADVARSNGAGAKADAYLATADDWQRRVEAMTATTNGPLSPKPYYLRITKDANPDDGSTYGLGDNFPRPVDEREIVDNSFLGLVLFGAKKWNDPTVLNSLAVGDRELRVDTPNGPVWHRFSHDGYGETARRRRLEHLPDRRGPDARARVAAAHRRARRVRAARGPPRGRLPGDDRADRQRRSDAARAGVREHRRGLALGHAAGLDARAVRPPGLVDPGGRADRAAVDRGGEVRLVAAPGRLAAPWRRRLRTVLKRGLCTTAAPWNRSSTPRTPRSRPRRPRPAGRRARRSCPAAASPARCGPLPPRPSISPSSFSTSSWPKYGIQLGGALVVGIIPPLERPPLPMAR